MFIGSWDDKYTASDLLYAGDLGNVVIQMQGLGGNALGGAVKSAYDGYAGQLLLMVARLDYPSGHPRRACGWTNSPSKSYALLALIGGGRHPEPSGGPQRTDHGGLHAALLLFLDVAFLAGTYHL
jgi:hypothetical protein